jgi:hypothetical protein
MEAIFCSLPKRVDGERALLLFFSESKTSRRIERLAADNKQRKEMGCDG